MANLPCRGFEYSPARRGGSGRPGASRLEACQGVESTVHATVAVLNDPDPVCFLTSREIKSPAETETVCVESGQLAAAAPPEMSHVRLGGEPPFQIVARHDLL